MGSWLWKPSVGIGLATTAGAGNASTIAPQLSSADQIRGLSSLDASLGFRATNPQAFVGSTYRANSFPAGLEANGLTVDSRSKFTSRKVNGLGFAGRAYSIPLSYLFGIFRNGGKYLPVRNMGAIELTLELAPYNRWFIQCAKTTFGENNVATMSTDNTAPYNAYQVSQVSVTVDALQIAPSLVNDIDALCAGPDGLAMVVDTYVSTVFASRPPSTSESFVCSRPFSNVLATYLSGRPTLGANSPFWRHADTYGGSKFNGLQATIGSLNFPLSSIRNTAEAWGELRKSLTRNGIALEKAPCVTWEAYNSNYASSYGPASAAARGTAPDLTLISSGTDAQRAAYASSTENLNPSAFLLGQSFARVLGSGAEISLSGCNSKLAGYSLTQTLNQIETVATPNNSNPLAAPPCTLDASLGDASFDWISTQVCSVLIKLAQNSVMISD
jgi:hypothetical protein